MNLSMVDQGLHNKHDLLKQVVRLNSENAKPACYFIIVWSWFRFFSLHDGHTVLLVKIVVLPIVNVK